MSTEGLAGIDALRKAMHEHAADAKAKAEATMAEVIETEKQKAADLEAADVLRRRLEQEADDRLTELDHIAGQRAYIAFGRRPSNDEPAPEPQAPAEPVDNGNDDSNDDAGNTPTRTDLSPVPPAEPSRRSFFSTSGWKGLAWFLALIGAVIGAIVARVTYDPMWSNVKPGDLHDFLVFLWFVALMAAGFFTGGFIGFNKEQARNNHTLAA